MSLTVVFRETAALSSVNGTSTLSQAGQWHLDTNESGLGGHYLVRECSVGLAGRF
jgi:hypothetical protein